MAKHKCEDDKWGKLFKVPAGQKIIACPECNVVASREVVVGLKLMTMEKRCRRR
jgi:hypothetical protein